MNKELVTVIVLTYNNFENIFKNLYSIYSQTYSNIQIIISDDGSKNFNLEKLNEVFNKKSKNITEIKVIRHEKNVGTVKNFNNAIRESKGRYIIPLSQDDSFFSRESIEKIVLALKENLIVTGLAVDKFGNTILSEKEIEIIESTDLYNYILLEKNLISGASTYYDKEIFNKYGYFDESYKLLEDAPYYVKLLENNELIKIIREKTIVYSKQGVSNSKKVNKVLANDWYLFFAKKSKEKTGFLKRILKFKKNEIKVNLKEKNKINLYFNYLDIFFIKIFEKIINKKIKLHLFKIINGRGIK